MKVEKEYKKERNEIQISNIKNRKPTRQEGITLLVLVITIVVLLILAGITINAVTGDNGAIVNASKAKFRTEIRDIEEKIELEEINHNNGEDFQFGTLKDLIGREDAYNEILYIEGGNLVYLENKVSEKQAEWLEEMGINAKQNIIPIYTGEQFKKIGTGEEIQIEEAGGETYQFNIDSHYVLQNDIDLNCSEENQWRPICISGAFKGILDGKNYRIKGIYINSEEQNKALIGYNDGTIQNVILSDGYISGTNGVAGIVYRNNTNGKITNCINQIEIYASGNTNGGIVADNRGIVENCENIGYMELTAMSGGICGVNSTTGSIIKCKNTHEILLRDFRIGGIVGSNSGNIRYSYTINTNEMIETNTGKVENCMQLSEAQMKNQESIILEDQSITSFLELLNKEGQYFKEDTKNNNQGYPILK